MSRRSATVHPCAPSSPPSRSPVAPARRPAEHAGGGAAGPDRGQGHRHACEVARREAPAGKIAFSINNGGSKVTEFYLYAEGDRIMGEVENIGPGLTRQLIVEVPDGGTYTTACKPGMVGDGIRAPFTVTGGARARPTTNAKLAEATEGYKRYVTSQVDALVRQDAGVRRRRQGRQRRRGQGAVPGLAHPTGSASSRWPSRSATSTPRSTAARTTSATPAWSSPASTASRRTCGSRPAARHRRDRRPADGRHQGPADRASPPSS